MYGNKVSSEVSHSGYLACCKHPGTFFALDNVALVVAAVLDRGNDGEIECQSAVVLAIGLESNFMMLRLV